jgi:hypothetical protein
MDQRTAAGEIRAGESADHGGEMDLVSWSKARSSDGDHAGRPLECGMLLGKTERAGKLHGARPWRAGAGHTAQGVGAGRPSWDKTRQGRAEKRAAVCREHGWRGATEKRRTMDGTPRDLGIGADSMGE